MNLNDLRNDIDKIDREIINLLEKRMDISKSVGDYKEKNNIPVLNINREMEVLNSIASISKNKEYTKQLTDVYIAIMKGSRSLQKNNFDLTYGLIGTGLSHSVSPEIHNKNFKENNLDFKYSLFDIGKENLQIFMEVCKAYGIKGFNVTMPFKIDVMEYLDEIHEIAQNIGSVNTVSLKDNKLKGYNTDYYGFEVLLKQSDIDVCDKKILILGSGGSSKTVTYYCKRNLAEKIYIVSRVEKNNNKSSEIEYLTYEYLENNLENINFDIIVNTTPVGMYPDMEKSAISKNIIKKANAVVDIIYKPKETLLLKLAKECGVKKVANGEAMVLAQAIKAQEIWISNI